VPCRRLLAGAIFTASVLATRVLGAAHPLEPLSTNELRAAVEVLLKENKISTNTLLPMVTLREPPKEKVLAWETGAALPREAFVTAYELASHRTYEAIVDLDQRRVTQWRHRPGVEPLQTKAELDASNQFLQTNELWLAALKRRGLTNTCAGRFERGSGFVDSVSRRRRFPSAARLAIPATRQSLDLGTP
jgi:Cu2+-containing amine oxidase